MDNHYGGVIWTNHVLQRLQERQISQDMALLTLKHPERSRFAATKQAWVYNKTFGRLDIEVVATQNERHEWVVMSVWGRPREFRKDRYLVRNGLVDWLLDHLIGLFKKPKHD
jgi:hypothetical protein